MQLNINNLVVSSSLFEGMTKESELIVLAEEEEMGGDFGP